MRRAGSTWGTVRVWVTTLGAIGVGACGLSLDASEPVEGGPDSSSPPARSSSSSSGSGAGGSSGTLGGGGSSSGDADADADADAGGLAYPNTGDCSRTEPSADCVDESHGVFVRHDANPGEADGSQMRPYPTIERALNNLGGRGFVFVCAGTYPAALEIQTPVVLIGGFDCTTWTRTPVVNDGPDTKQVKIVTTQNQPSLTLTSPIYVGVVNMEIQSRAGESAESNSGVSSVAAFVRGGGWLEATSAVFRAGGGARGRDGAPHEPNSQPQASSGNNNTGGPSSCMAPGGRGGQANNNATAGSRSAKPGCRSRVENVEDSPANCKPGSRRDEDDATAYAGGDGDNGVAAPSNDVPTSSPRIASITQSGFAWQVESSSSRGQAGGSGGGGGQSTPPPGSAPNSFGGGGGAGGCGGIGGNRGGHGGSSIAVLVHGATFSATSSWLRTTTPGNGGNGGRGQDGGRGGDRGRGGVDGWTGDGGSGAGGNGGNGGNGGHGGVSVALLADPGAHIVWNNDELSESRETLNAAGLMQVETGFHGYPGAGGPGANGGQGGNNGAPGGQPGLGGAGGWIGVYRHFWRLTANPEPIP